MLLVATFRLSWTTIWCLTNAMPSSLSVRFWKAFFSSTSAAWLTWISRYTKFPQVRFSCPQLPWFESWTWLQNGFSKQIAYLMQAKKQISATEKLPNQLFHFLIPPPNTVKDVQDKLYLETGDDWPNSVNQGRLVDSVMPFVLDTLNPNVWFSFSPSHFRHVFSHFEQQPWLMCQKKILIVV